ncbi:unnamed protein product [Meloidogyne enterolobii]|uniref:Uncharacterized protein n=1 Tax=Meloidogyne enterolobii TaxID=390850 RepID=A0ACB0YWW1_MELEN
MTLVVLRNYQNRATFSILWCILCRSRIRLTILRIADLSVMRMFFFIFSLFIFTK